MDSNTLLSSMQGTDVDATDVVETNGDPFGWDAAGDLWDMFLSGGYQDDTVQSKFDYLLDVIDGDPNFSGTAADNTGLERVNLMRAKIGAITNRLEHAVNNMTNQRANTQAAESAIRDADFASETTQFTKSRILTQSATAMLAQANMVPQSALGLIR